MRMRKKKNGASRIAACGELLINDTGALFADPQFAFGEKRELHLEIGCGKGSFACGMARDNQNVNFIAMEKVSDVACLALEKAQKNAEERPNDNLRFIIGDASNLLSWLPKSSVDCIYLNFSDPWPKSGHAKRRLTYRSFLDIYSHILKPNGILRIKTDNEGLFDFSIEEFREYGLYVEWQTRDLHSSEYAKGNVVTEYEANFTAKGMPIYAAKAVFPKEKKHTLIKELVKRERSYRSFDERIKITNRELVGFIENARLTPSAMNLQPIKYKLCAEKEEVDAILPLTRWAAGLKGVEIPPKGHAPVAYIVICVDTEISNMDFAMHDVGIVAQTIMLSAVEAGYGGCMIRSFDHAGICAALGLKESIKPSLVIGLGKPDETVVVVGVENGNVKYYRDSKNRHFVPKRDISELIL